jgi:hypothetical protein
MPSSEDLARPPGPVDDAVVDEEQTAGGEAVAEQPPADGSAHGDHAVAGRVLQAGEGAAHGERDAAARHQARPPAEPGREQARGRRVRVVGVHDVRGFRAEDPGQPEDRAGSEVAAEDNRAHGEPGGSRPGLEPPSGLTGHGDGVAAGGHALRRQQHLALATPPFAGRVDVHDAHVSKMRRRSASSLHRRVKSLSGM